MKLGKISEIKRLNKPWGWAGDNFGGALRERGFFRANNPFAFRPIP
jgi:hypothetical protein